MKQFCAAACRRAELPLMVAVSLVWPLALYVMFRACFGTVRECDIDPVTATGWAVVLSVLLWLATCTMKSNSLPAKLLRMACLVYLVAVTMFGFHYVVSSVLSWSSGDLGFRLMAASFIYLPYLLVSIASIILSYRVLRDIQNRD